MCIFLFYASVYLQEVKKKHFLFVKEEFFFVLKNTGALNVIEKCQKSRDVPKKIIPNDMDNADL